MRSPVIGRRKLVCVDRPVAARPSADTPRVVPATAIDSAIVAYRPPCTSPTSCPWRSCTSTRARTRLVTELDQLEPVEAVKRGQGVAGLIAHRARTIESPAEPTQPTQREIPRLLFGRMDSPERLAGDQRAVLQLVLGQGRSYGEIAGMLSIAPDEVRARALAALDALGPPTTVPDADRARIADYLLGQLAAADGERVRDALAGSPGQRAWARVVSSELGPLASRPAAADPGPAGDAGRRPASRRDDADAESGRRPGQRSAAGPGRRARRHRSSRTGGIVLLSVLAAAIIAAVVIFVIKPGGGSGKHHDPSATVAGGRRLTARRARAPRRRRPARSQSAAIVGQINLTPPTGGGKTKGVALVLRQGSLKGLGIEAEHVPPTTTKPRTTYAVWLYNSPSDATLLGYFSKGVNKKGALGSTAELPANAAHYKYLIITWRPATRRARRRARSCSRASSPTSRSPSSSEPRPAPRSRPAAGRAAWRCRGRSESRRSASTRAASADGRS